MTAVLNDRFPRERGCSEKAVEYTLERAWFPRQGGHSASVP
ncbi:hypothetical protein ACFCWD_18755 [Streptomyces sp. NPDC056374]